jgi:hypothetical protein
MDKSYRPRLDQRHVTGDDALRLYRAWASFGQEMITRPLRLYGDASERITDSVASGLLRSWDTSAILSDLSREYVAFATGLLAVPGSTIGTAVTAFDAPTPDPLDHALSGATPDVTVSRVTIDQEIAVAQRRELARRAGFEGTEPILDFPTQAAGAPFLLPARILDASQGWASWFIPVEAARQLMRQACDLGHQPPEVLDAFEPVTVGPGDAMITLLASDYRASDFGVTQEIGLSLSVTPRDGRMADPGQLFLRLIVTDPFSLAAARQIWGIRKDLRNNAAAATPAARLEAAYGPDRVVFGLGARLPKTDSRGGRLQIGFPRFGTGRSDRMPGVIYSMTEPHGPPAAPVAPSASILTRSGAREGVQVGGQVTLNLPESPEAGKAAGCLCAGGMACLCATLRGLGLDRRRPAANGWTDRMTGTLGEPVPLWDQPSGK